MKGEKKRGERSLIDSDQFQWSRDLDGREMARRHNSGKDTRVARPISGRGGRKSRRKLNPQSRTRKGSTRTVDGLKGV